MTEVREYFNCIYNILMKFKAFIDIIRKSIYCLIESRPSIGSQMKNECSLENAIQLADNYKLVTNRDDKEFGVIVVIIIDSEKLSNDFISFGKQS